MNIYQTFATDQLAEKNGITLDLGDGVTIAIRRAGGHNAAFARVLEAKSKPYRRQIDLGTLDPDLNRRLMVEVYADTIALGWTGITDRSGTELPFTRDNFIAVMTDLPDLFALVTEEANRLANFRAADIEETASALGNGSSGISNGAKASRRS